MVDQARISDMILDDGFGLEIQHNEETDTPDDSNGTSELLHYGILGMKWGVRRTPEQLGRRKKKNRRYENETPQEYQARLNRESAERTAKINAKAKADSEKRAIAERAASQKRQLRSQEKTLKYQLKSQEKEKAAIRNAEEKERKRQAEAQKEQEKNAPEKKKTETSSVIGVKSMTDQELRDAIVRLRAEKEYIQMMKKPDGFLKKTAKSIGKAGGGMLLQVGKNIAIKQLSDIGNAKADDYLKKKGIKKDPNAKAEEAKNQKENAYKQRYGGVDSNVLNQLFLLEENNKR